MSKIQTADEFLSENINRAYYPFIDENLEDNQPDVTTIRECMIEFAKLHVTAALKTAKKRIRKAKDSQLSESTQMYKYEDTILSAYPLTLII